MRYRAAAALTYDDRGRATADLREQLRVMAAAAGATVDWSTLEVEGPVEASGLWRASWFEWTATANVIGGSHDLRDAILDAAVASARPAGADLTAEDTSPLPAA